MSGRTDISTTLYDLHRAAAAFLITDLKLALASLDTATYFTSERRARGYQNSRGVYHFVMRSHARITLTLEERRTILWLLRRLNARLEAEAQRC